MKTILLRLLPVVFVATALQSCLQNTVAPLEKAVPGREEIITAFEQNLYQVVAARKIQGTDTLDMLTGDAYTYRKTTYLIFKNETLYYCTGGSIPNTTFPATATVFSVGRRVELPVNLRYEWDDQENTLKVKSYGQSQSFPMIKEGQQGFLQKDNLVFYKTRDEAQTATVAENMTFRYQDSAPAGTTTYLISLKPMWFVGPDPVLSNTFHYVMF